MWLYGKARISVLMFALPILLQWVHADDFHFDPEPEDTSVQEGNEAVLQCRVDAEGIIFHWTLNDQILDENSRRFVNGSDLTFRRVDRRKDLGQFKCVARNATSGHAIVSQPVQLDISWISETVRVVTSDFSSDLTLGKTLELHCRSQGNPDAKTEWFLNGKKIAPIDMEERITLHSNQLQIKNLSIHDNGIYSCKASNPSGHVESNENFALRLVGADIPHITEIPRSVVVPLNGSAYFDCSYENAPSLDWFFNNQEISLINSTRHIIFPNGSLHVLAIEKTDEGYYICALSSPSTKSIPSQRYAAFLKVARIMNFTEYSLETSANTLSVGDNYEVFCSKPEGFPIPRLWWEDQSGYVISDSGRVRVDDTTLIINDVQKSDHGNYTCIAENSAGQTRIAAPLYVIEKLKFLPAPVNRKLELASNAKIYCKAGGASSPLVKWMKHENQSTEWPPHIRDDNGTLHFNGVLNSDSGKYTCVASNAQGVINASINVDVIVMPKFSIYPSDTEAIEGYPIAIHCLVEGDPQPTIQWDKNNVLNGFDQSRFKVMKNGSLFVSVVHLEDQGKYGCTAGNSGGLRRSEMSLIVKTSHDYNTNEAGLGGLGMDTENTMGKTVAITLGAAAVYMILVIGLMIWCRYRRAQRKAAVMAQATTAAEKRETIENGDVVPDIELKENPNHASTSNSNSNIPTKIKKIDSSLVKLQYSREKLQTVMLLGHGEYGQVFLAKAPGIVNENEETVVMVKSLESNENLISEFQNEINMFNALSHPNITPLLGICQEADPMYMIMNYADWGDLKQFLLATRPGEKRKGPKPPPLTLQQIIDICHQIAIGMEYLSEKSYTHKDIAARNCLISSSLKVTISKPSLSQDTYSQEYYQHKNKILPLRWAAPESIIEDKWSNKSDIWSFGVLIWELFTKAEMPFSKFTDDEIMKNIEENKLIWDTPNDAPPELSELLMKCWNNYPENRPSFTDFCSLMTKLKNSENS